MCKIFAGIPRQNYVSETRSVRLGGHSTSIRLERAYWDLLERLAHSQDLTLGRLLSELHEEVLNLHGEARNFSSLLRCVCLLHLERTFGAEGYAFPAPERT
ncbi:MAG: ribbon-helix-helix domain-containing protein [Devosia sp.]